MNSAIPTLAIAPSSLRTTIKSYLRATDVLRKRLYQHPDESYKYQAAFNKMIDSISAYFMGFEKYACKDENVIRKMKDFFSRRLRKHFLYGTLVPWSLRKPFGYAGDFKIIESIYAGAASTTGFDRLFDQYFLNMPASVATRNRKNDFKKIIYTFVTHKGGNVRILNIGAGPCREIKELVEEYPSEMSTVTFDCIDSDQHAVDYAKNLLANVSSKVNLFRRNVLRLALAKDVTRQISDQYDLIYSTGLFDYLPKQTASLLLHNLTFLLKEDGAIAVSNYRDKFSNPSAYLMEWVTDWRLTYRTEEIFQNLFIKAGFSKKQLSMFRESQGVMQYCIAFKLNAQRRAIQL